MTFAMRKQLQAEHGKADIEKRINEFEAKKKMQTAKVIELKGKLEAIENRKLANRDVDAKKRLEENKFLAQQNQHLNKFLKIINEAK